MKTSQLFEIIKLEAAQSARSQWERGVLEYATELAEFLKENFKEVKKRNLQEACLNGANTWLQYSEGACSLVYDEDIAKRLATKSEIKARTYKNGTLSNQANSRETWLQVQARALYQAYRKLNDIVMVFDND